MTDAGPAGKATLAREMPAPPTAARKRNGNERIEREAAARRAVFVASLAGFLAVFGLIAVSGKPTPVSSEEAVQVDVADTSPQVIAEVPVANLNGDGGETIIRLVAPERLATAPLVTHATFPAMSVTIEITAVDVPPAAVTQAVTFGRHPAADWESRFSRFRPDSQLSRLNMASGVVVPLDAVFIEMLETAHAAVHRTGGRFDPSILPALEVAGYDRSIEQVDLMRRPIAGNTRPAAGLAGWDLVHIDRARGQVRLPPGMRIDLGGVAKGAFVDRFAAELRSWPGGAIDAGGDLYLWGHLPDGEQWVIGIEDPFRPQTDHLAAQLDAIGGIGVATSGIYRRRWQVGDQTAHHLIDPRNGIPVSERVRSVTTFAIDTRTTDIAATALLLAAAEHEGSELFGAITAVITYADGAIGVLPEVHVDESSLSLSAPIHATA